MKIYNELESLGFFEWLSETHNMSDTDMKPDYLDGLPLNDIHRTVGNSMVFRWFREKYKLHQYIKQYYGENFFFHIEDMVHPRRFDEYTVEMLRTFNESTSQEESEFECISKLIEIVKTK